jgi:hypothetical protein
MKICIKKIFCTNCRQLVKGQEQSGNGQYRVLCSECGKTICISNGIYWRRAQEGESTPNRETEGGSAAKGKKTRLSKNQGRQQVVDGHFQEKMN